MELAIVIVSGGVLLLLGGIVFIRKPRSATHLLFLLLSITLILWETANYFSLHPPTEHTLFWIRLVMFFAAPLSVTLLLFIITFPKDQIPLARPRLFGLLGATAATMAVALSPFLFTSLQVAADGSLEPQAGPGMVLFIPVAIGSILAAMVLLVFKWHRAKDRERIQLLYLLVGTGSFWGLLILTVFIPVVFFDYTAFVPLSPLWALAFIAATAYSIVRYRLMDIRVVATYALVIVLAVLMLFRLLVSATLSDIAFNGVSLFGVVFTGMFLVRSVRKEIRQREELEELSESLEAANKELKKLDQAKTEFLSIASHQLRTPLTAIKGFLSLMLEGSYGEVTPKQREQLGKVLEANEGLIRLINELLNISRIEAGRMEYAMAPMDAKQLVTDVVEQLQPLAADKHLELSFAAPETVPEVEGDPDKLRQVFTNLIENAIKYTTKGSVKVSIVPANPELVVRIQDTGRGVTEEERGQMFQRFRRGEGAEEAATGTGLGLWVVHEIISAHHGSVTVESEGRDKGSTFVVHLPFVPNRTTASALSV